MNQGRRHQDSELAELVRLSAEGFLVLDMQGIVIFANPAAERLLGRAPGKALGTDFGFPVTASEPALITLMRAAGEAATVEMRAVEGQWQEQPAFIVNLHDITARKRAFDQAEHLAAIVQSADIAIIGMTLEGCITSWNPGATRMYGYTEAQAIGSNIRMIVPAYLLDNLTALLQRVGQGKTVSQPETVRCTKAGEELHVNLTMAPLRDEAGKIVGISVVAEDTSRQRRERLALAQQTHELEKRVKEQSCMYACARLAYEADTMPELAAAMVEVLPCGWQFPDKVCARVQVDECAAASALFRETPWHLQSEILVAGESRGRVEIYYLEECPPADEGPFIQEECQLVQAVAELLAQSLASMDERQRAERLNRMLRALQAVNQLIGREKDQAKLISQVCELLVDAGNFVGSWVALWDHDGHVVDYAYGGMEPEVATTLTAYVDEQGEALIRDRHCGVGRECTMFTDLDETCSNCPLRRIVSSKVVLAASLKYGARRFGCLTVCRHSEVDEDPEERPLLQEIADDLAFALHNLEAGRDRERGERLLAEVERVAQVGGWEWNLHDDTYHFTGEWLQIHGLSRPPTSDEELLGIVHPLDRERMQACVQGVRDGALSYDAEYRIIRQDSGEERYIRAHGERLGAAGESRMIGASFDVTERHASMAQLQFQARMLNSIGEAVVVVDPLGTIVFWNGAAERLYGWAAAEVLGKSIVDVLMSPELRDAGAQILQQLQQGITWSGELRILRKDGSSFDAMHSGTPVVGDDGKPEVIIGISSDITARKKAARALEDANLMLDSAVSAGRVGLWDCDLVKGKVIYSAQWKRQLGYDEDEVGEEKLGEWMKRLHPDDLQPVLDYMQRGLDSGTTEAEMEFRLRHKDGTYRWIFEQATVLRNDAGEAIRVLGSHVDVTELRRAEQERLAMAAQLQQAQKLESIGRLAGGVAHDFNNKLSVILGFAQLAMMRMDADDPMYGRLQQICNAAESAAGLTRQLLAFARKEAIVPKVLSLNDLVAGMLKMLGRLIGEDVTLAWKPASKLWKVRVDPGQIDQILVNLVVNARDAINGVGRITIGVQNVNYSKDEAARHPEAVAAGPYVMLMVCDTGTGMDQATVERIFEPFFTTKPQGQGTGLGLSTVYGVVKQNEGFIEVTTEPGCGTTFRIYLPAMPDAEQEAVDVQNTDPMPTGSETLLLVEDELPLLNLVAMLLEEAGYTVLRAPTPYHALALAREHRESIDLLVTDVVMPEKNGKELRDELLMEIPRLKCLFMSGYTADIIAHRGVLEESLHFIQKPFEAETLARKVRDILDAPSPATDA